MKSHASTRSSASSASARFASLRRCVASLRRAPGEGGGRATTDPSTSRSDRPSTHETFSPPVPNLLAAAVITLVFLPLPADSSSSSSSSSSSNRNVPHSVRSFSNRADTTVSSPENAPPQTNKMFVVSTCVNSPLGFFLPPFSGTFTTHPSTIFSSACCTPSPLTSRVIATFSAFLVSLSISSMYTMPRSANSTSNLASCKSLYKSDSTSSPTYPAWVNVVASAMTMGTSTNDASVFARSVFPHPVGPQRTTLDFSSVTASSAAAGGDAPESVNGAGRGGGVVGDDSARDSAPSVARHAAAAAAACEPRSERSYTSAGHAASVGQDALRSDDDDDDDDDGADRSFASSFLAAASAAANFAANALSHALWCSRSISLPPRSARDAPDDADDDDDAASASARTRE
eukprot:30771-Pelagococcus_subviridis.AAC.1